MTTPKKKKPVAKKAAPRKAAPKKEAPKKPAEPELKKVAVICGPGLDNHLGEVADFLKANYEVKICITADLETMFNAVKWADVVWIEWANQTAVDVTSLGHLMYHKQVILRLHSYEAFIPQLAYIHWAAVTDLIFIAEHIKAKVLRDYPTIKYNVNRIHVIPNGIDLDRFKMPASKKYMTASGKDIAYLGYLNFKKGTQLMLTAFAELVRNDPEFVLHIGGAFQEERYIEYLNQMYDQHPELKDKIRFHGWIEDPVKFLSDKSHVICTSLLESQAKFVMEGMAMGCKPLIHNFVGAKGIYPPGLLWETIGQFCDMARTGGNRVVYRDFIHDNYNTKDIVKRIGDLIDKSDEKKETFKEGDQPPIKLSVAMIMKDEEKNLPRCLDSIKGIADELVIVDTGSTDKSMEIAKKYGAKIYEHPWQDNFSLHRNQSIGYCTGDWILTIDCDEELTGNVEGLKTTLSKLQDIYNAVSINLKDANQDVGNEVNATRIFRAGKVKYRRAWHNVPIAEGMDEYGAVLYADATLIHYGSINQMGEEDTKRKAIRTKQLIEKSLEDDPEDWELYFYLFQTYGTEEKWQAAVNCGEKYLAQRNNLPGFQLAIYHSMIRVYAIHLENIPRAMELFQEAIILLPEDLDVAYVQCELGVLTGRKDMILEGARRFNVLYSTFSRNPSAKGGRFIFHLNPDSLFFCLKHSTDCLMQDGVESLKLLQKSVGLFPQDRRADVEKQVAEVLQPLGIDTN